MRNSSKRVISIFVSLLFFVGSLVVYAYLIKPGYADIQVKRGELLAKEKQYQEHKEIINKAKEMVNSYQSSYSQAQQNISLVLPTSSQIPHAIAQVNGLALANNLSIQTLAARETALTPSSDPALIKSVGTVRFSLNISGSYESLRSFLDGIENNIRVFNPSEVKIQKLGSNPNSLVINIDVDTYYQGSK